MIMKSARKAYCPVDFAFQKIGGKYKGRILWFLKDGVIRYGELRRKVEGISPKMLTQALKELEADALVERKVYHEIPPHVEYNLTPRGEQLIPAIDLLRLWAIAETTGVISDEV
jgi:DNA-binding HxlR family transcriptional regulator